ncbi:hypothetical protein A2334_04715 [Candidatus Roizmanbacteria bacterium RIFOXYB2_FULL_38_10]|uniref:EamA domain-containing protein n=1 Tax=Candidatus Roizmanbacteria bacterium RIFOXYD1_FULL_38_12 TaxID=1802093 RepID=A0A1F7KZS0_9BACT|nr:MAG: hypothetical protein A3K47_00815 [Candidatus Roizmanbacteria bacterium RIFOXYA2_FULL_38_14]OGK63328.1 MAG: hypothetical protein A3K27_00815 [Candidatus Roizmanbacteria bacterium RIFOXYA1_FULL_37_12]OGK65174.1 MAG: hypothetical protein A3K38_00815 [Candidatus Roizmanbacteria bacterium RIFOXYB1_FULL_40_23]OGK68730.1 MAG: hypothetical protein A2334_04715 [Candidatus Roizmanbacteria bacterium RIFOXYB2_FULL_38_10]OGK69579.1 MAG: hypothetical protein A3K21_00820 [Candidatus Roizmanbacteria ba
MIKQNDLMKGILLAFITSIISGVAIFYSKISVAKIDPLVLTTLRNLFVGLIFFCFLLFNRKLSQLKTLTKRELILLVLIGIIGGSVPFYLFFSGIKMIGMQSANIIHKSLFIWVTLLAGLFLGEKLNLGFIAAGLLVFIGNFFFVPVQMVFGRGEQLVLLATLLWSVENILAKRVLSKTSSELVGIFRMSIGGLVLLFITFVTGKAALLFRLNSSELFTIFIGGSILFFYVFTWYKSLKYAPASLVVLILTFSLVVGNILSGVFAQTKLSMKEVGSIILVGNGVAILLLTKLLAVVKPKQAK